MEKYRELTGQEKSILNKLLEKSFPGCDELKRQLALCKAVSTNDSDNYGSIYLKTDANERANVSTRVPVEGRVSDSDGGSIDILLHVIDGKLNELEIFRADGMLLKSSIDPSHIEIITNRL